MELIGLFEEWFHHKTASGKIKVLIAGFSSRFLTPWRRIPMIPVK